jgi:lipopolysaccharide transport system ATP-binding protein
VVEFIAVYKKFRRGERHDSLRDAFPSIARRLIGARNLRGASSSEFWALEDVSFQVGRGEALGIIGPNGAGKSTALKLLARILKPTHGVSQVHGRVGALIEVASGFHPDLTGRENIYLQGAIMGMRRAEIARAFDEIIEFSGVGEFIDTPVKRYSSGMNARLGFSIAAHLHPEILIVDEVLSVGDRAFQQKCETRMRQFRDNGAAIVFVSHNLHAIHQLCTSAVLLDRGRVARAGATAEVIQAYGAAGAGAAERGELDGAASLAARVLNAPAEGLWTVRPGETIRLAVEVDFHQVVERAAVTVVVWDVAQNICAYSANSEMVGVEGFRARPSDHASYRFGLVANLTRGVYAIEVVVYDVGRPRRVASLRPVRQFTVAEEISHSGTANLYLSAESVDHATALRRRVMS